MFRSNWIFGHISDVIAVLNRCLCHLRFKSQQFQIDFLFENTPR